MGPGLPLALARRAPHPTFLRQPLALQLTTHLTRLMTPKGSADIYNRGGSPRGERSAKVGLYTRLADDGKRSSGDGRYSTIASRREEEIGEGSGEGRVKNSPL